ncbi:glycine-rich RNA-binding protein blt801-like [Haliotis rubra]|uniref:glycine-rich RNA-binding protein blt801-like n=1 Tax=Haliotis rubra TaxID=36100 RepID=UPI001EE6056F|nr:glycine-rich RNA-binding protein blt801-like [Haliotis rubra]
MDGQDGGWIVDGQMDGMDGGQWREGGQMEGGGGGDGGGRMEGDGGRMEVEGGWRWKDGGSGWRWMDGGRDGGMDGHGQMEEGDVDRRMNGQRRSGQTEAWMRTTDGRGRRRRRWTDGRRTEG